jgi:hypothetical protein
MLEIVYVQTVEKSSDDYHGMDRDATRRCHLMESSEQSKDLLSRMNRVIGAMCNRTIAACYSLPIGSCCVLQYVIRLIHSRSRRNATSRVILFYGVDGSPCGASFSE